MKIKEKKRDPYFMYLGNLLIFENNVGTVSDIKYVVIRDRKHLFFKNKYYAFPGKQEVLVGSYEIDPSNCDLPILINAERLHQAPFETKIGLSEVIDIIFESNGISKLKSLKIL